MKLNLQKGFTLFETLIVVGMLGILSAITTGAFVLMQQQSDLDAALTEVATVLKFAQSRTLASENDAQYGVYFDVSTTPNQYILFKGASYATRDVAYDQIKEVPKTTEFFSISLGASSQIVFDKLSGGTLQPGSVPIRYKNNTSQLKTIYVASSGRVSFSPEVAPSDVARIKDARHLHLDYSRNIATATESVVLNFNNGVVIQNIPISSNMSGGQIDWEGTVNVAGSNQTVRVHTHRLNNSDTQFSIHRGGLNNATLKVTLSGDTSGYLVQYAANGLSTNSTSIYASNLAWQ